MGYRYKNKTGVTMENSWEKACFENGKRNCERNAKKYPTTYCIFLGVLLCKTSINFNNIVC